MTLNSVKTSLPSFCRCGKCDAVPIDVGLKHSTPVEHIRHRNVRTCDKRNAILFLSFLFSVENIESQETERNIPIKKKKQQQITAWHEIDSTFNRCKQIWNRFSSFDRIIVSERAYTLIIAEHVYWASSQNRLPFTTKIENTEIGDLV